jgi:hypothetical protein
MNVKEEIRSQSIGALSGARFPIHTPEELQNAMPAGVDVCCKAGDTKVTAEEADICWSMRISRSAVPSKRQTRSSSGQGCNHIPLFLFPVESI